MSPVNYRDLPPIPEDERVSRPEKLSQTFLAKFASCPRSAYLYRKYNGGAPSAAMLRGSLMHEAIDVLTNMLLTFDEPTIPPEIARDVFNEVLGMHPEWVLQPAEVDAARMMVYKWTQFFKVRVEAVFGIEQMWMIELPDGTIVRGKLDLLELIPGMVFVKDYKSSLAMKSTEDWHEDFQNICYKLLVAYGHTDDGEVLPGDVHTFMGSVVYPRYEFDGELGCRDSIHDRIDLQDHYAYLIDLVNKVDYAFETGKFPALPGSHCNECPASSECPLLATLRDGAGEIRTHEDATRAAEDRYFHQRESKRNTANLRKWVNEYGPVPFGNREVAIVESQSRKVNWETLTPAIERSIEYGEEFVESDHVQTSTGTKITDRKRELEEDE